MAESLQPCQRQRPCQRRKVGTVFTVCGFRVVIHSVSRRFKEVERMANIKSAMKRVKVNKVKAAANKARKSELKTVLKKANLAAESGANKEEAIKAAIKRVDQACAKGLLHKNNAARKKAQLAKKLNG